jgi:N-acyl-D-amino-acid deacylase
LDLDVRIAGGTVVDGTGSPGLPGDLGIRDGRIAALGRPGSLDGAAAKRTIDATGLVVAPGFIDIHTHSDVTTLDDPGAESKVHQGVTTEVTGNCSDSPFPIGPGGPEPLRAIFGPDLISARPWTWTTLRGWALAHEERGISLNLAPLVGHSALRLAVGLDNDRPPTSDEVATMARLNAESIEAGAFGFSTGLTLTPSSFATTDEIVAIAAAMAPFPGAFYATHSRLWAGQHVAAVEEAAEIGRRAGVPVEYSHIAIVDSRAFGRAGDMLAVIEKARAQGVDMTCDVYPYTAAGTHLMQLLPEWVQDGGVESMLARFRDPGERNRLREDTAKGWFRGLPWDWDSLVISDIESEGNRSLVGSSIAAAAAVRGEDPLDTFLGLIDEESNAVAVVAHNRTEGDMRTFLAHSSAMVGSDGTAISPSGRHGRPQRPHPRYYGTFPRVLGRYVREEPVLSLPDAVHKMTGLPARRLGLQDRGHLAEGLAADVAVFDPATVIDRATFADPHQTPIGIPYVLVNGVMVIDDGRHTGARPGQVLRRQAH